MAEFADFDRDGRVPGDETMYEYFLASTAEFGDYPVFQHRFRDHMRSEFVRDIEALACYFKFDKGLTAGDVYTVFMPTSAEAMMIFMALNKLGVTVNFVLPILPPEALRDRMRFTRSKGVVFHDRAAKAYAEVLKEENVSVLLCSLDMYAAPDKYDVLPDPYTVAAFRKKKLDFDFYTAAVEKYEGRVTNGVKHAKDRIAVYMHGGGTTGRSRTIKLSNYALNNVARYTNSRTAHPGVDTEICSMPFFHAYGLVAGGTGPLNRGKKVVFQAAFNAEDFIDIMRYNHVVQFSGVPNMFKKLLATPGWDGPQLASLIDTFGGGDDVGVKFMEQYRAVYRKNGSGADLFQGYGLTECGAVCIKNIRGANKVGSIGRPLPCLHAEIWDENHAPVPNGTVGEIALTGDTMMEGYLTADGAVDDGLYTDGNGKKWVLTGDLAYRDDDGFFFFRGRKKRLVIISGYNVYPVDIEKVMIDIPFVKESCSVQGFDENGKILIRLYVVLHEGETGDREFYRRVITEECRKHLVKYAVPRDIRFIDALPRTNVQKVDFMRMTQNTPEDPIYG